MNQVVISRALFIGLLFGGLSGTIGIPSATPGEKAASKDKGERLPKVELLAVRDPGGDIAFEDMPQLANGAVRIAYRCEGAHALKRADLRYRIIPPGDGPKANPVPWQTLPLKELLAKPEWGSFDLSRGTFEKSQPRDQVPFHALAGEPARRAGGGRFELSLKNEKTAKPGGRVEFFIEVFDEHHEKPGRSETRVKALVSEAQFLDWLRTRADEDKRLRELERKQRKVFDP
jgi:hypothetical protein